MNTVTNYTNIVTLYKLINLSYKLINTHAFLQIVNTPKIINLLTAPTSSCM